MPLDAPVMITTWSLNPSVPIGSLPWSRIHSSLSRNTSLPTCLPNKN